MNRFRNFNGFVASSLAVILALCITFLPCLSHAGMESEIDHLLEYIETSGCTFNRNGTIHDSQDACEHIRKKYTHTKRYIKTTEDFIQYAATKSSMSGRPYQVTCEGNEMPTAKWLLDELARFRKTSQ